MPAVEAEADPAPVARSRRRSRAQRLRERPLPEISPLAYDEKHPVREAGADPEPTAPGGILRMLGMLGNALAVISGRGPVLEGRE